MAEIKNLSWQTLALPTGHKIEANSTLVTTNDVIDSPDNAISFPAMIAAGVLKVVRDVEAEEPAQPVKKQKGALNG